MYPFQNCLPVAFIAENLERKTVSIFYLVQNSGQASLWKNQAPSIRADKETHISMDSFPESSSSSSTSELSCSNSSFRSASSNWKKLSLNFVTEIIKVDAMMKWIESSTRNYKTDKLKELSVSTRIFRLFVFIEKKNYKIIVLRFVIHVFHCESQLAISKEGLQNRKQIELEKNIFDVWLNIKCIFNDLLYLFTTYQFDWLTSLEFNLVLCSIKLWSLKNRSKIAHDQQ